MSPDLEALRLRVERAELEVRLLEALVRIRRGDHELAAARVRNERSIGIHRDQEYACSDASVPGA